MNHSISLSTLLKRIATRNMVDVFGSFLSAFLQVLFDRIAHRELIDFFRGNHLDETLLEKLKMLMLAINTVLVDAEEKQFIDPLVKEWVNKLKHAAYDADDLLDEIGTKALQDKMDSEAQKTLNPVRDYTSLNPFVERVKSKVDKIIQRLNSLIEYKDLLGLKEGSAGKSFMLSPPTTSLVDEHEVFGRDADKEKIIEFLLSGNACRDAVLVVALVGMGGIGKTTLAQILYNDVRVRNHFRLRSWASVSETSSVLEITKKIFESFTLWYSNITDLNVLQLKLKDKLARQRFLLVLDGFWNDDFLDWDVLRRPFKSGESGSTIIVTTRNQSVARTVRAGLTHSLSLLSQEDNWNLFSSHAFKSGNANEQPDLKEIGQKIVRNCNGLPLAAKTLGSLLRTKENVEEWDYICGSKIWEFPHAKSNILPALILSYSHLPSHLKRCFTYCSIFPKGYEIEKWNLIHLWMAEGILPQPKTEKRMEDVGDECFQELLSRSFFQQSSGHQSCFIMHDLVNDLAQFVAGEFCYKLEDRNPSKITIKARHLSYLQGIYDAPEKFETVSEFQQLRTFLPFRFSYFGHSSSITSMVSVLLPKLKHLRVLSLSHYPITMLPDSVRNLIHLRYLDLSYTAIRELPDSVGTLYNLQTLILSGCRCLTKLPTSMFSLVNLRHLHINGSSLIKMPTQFSRLKLLQVLTTFVVNKDQGASISELGELSQLRGALSIVNLQNVINAEDAYDASLKNKRHLHELEFKWTTAIHDIKGETEVLDMLEPHENVRSLRIENFGGDKLPNWLGRSSFTSMVLLHLVECGGCLSLPSLGQLPSLRELHIVKMIGIEKVGPEFYGNVIVPFRSLKILKFEDMANWKEWSPSDPDQCGDFPTLQELQIQRCPRLIGKLPGHLPSLDKLVISACQVLEDLMPWVPRLRDLELTGCDALVSLPERMMQENTCLQTVIIRNCSSLANISTDCLPGTLRSLVIYECRNLQLFPSQHVTQEDDYYPAVEHLHLNCCCSSLISFPLSFFTKLEDLHIQDCSHLQFISSSPHGLPYLRKLKIKQCSKLVLFPEGGLPAPKLESLSISKCANLSPQAPWGLEKMASLTSLHISGLPNLTSLEHAGIQYLSTLRILKIKACDKLATLPLEILATSLFHLTIRGCPLLKQLCERDRGIYWDLVSRIPSRVIEE